MALASVRMKIKKNREAEAFAEEEFLVDSGASFTVASAETLARLGIEPFEEREFALGNGHRLTRKVGEAYFEFGENQGTSKVIFGEAGDCNLLGVLTLGAFGLVLHPLKRELKAMPMLLT